jgi:hypothetical protein
MRPLVLMLTLAVGSLAAAQEPIAPAVEQADDAEVPPASPPATPPPPPAPVVAAPVLLQPPPGWRYQLLDAPPTTEKRWGLFIAGIVTFTVLWAANLQAGIPTGEWRLDIPLFGPLFELSRIGDGGGFAGFFDLLLVSDAALQIGGLAMMIAGATTSRTKPGRQRIELVPLGAGVALRGAF